MKLLSFDVETAGTENLFALQPCRALTQQAWLTSCAAAFSDDDDTCTMWSTGYPTTNQLRMLLTRAIENDYRIVGWNTAFDCSWLIALGLGDLVTQCKWLDAMLLWRHLRNHPTFEITKESMGFGLKVAVAHYYPEHAGYGDAVHFDPKHDPEKLKDLLVYNERDVQFTVSLARLFWKQLSPEQRRVALIEAASIPLVAHTLVHGIVADGDKALALQHELLDDSTHAFVRLRLEDSTIDEEIISSPKQLGQHMTQVWKLPVVKFTEKGAISVDRESLSYLAVMDERASLLNDYREAKGNRIKFAEGVIDSLAYNGDGRVRPAHRMFGTYTGRMTISSKQGKGVNEVCTGIALHQWKREARFRSLIKPPPGYVLAEFDFAGQEFRWMAVVADDPTMLALCQPGMDAHSYMAAQIQGVPYEDFKAKLDAGDKEIKKQRQLGKVANLSLQYRTSAQKLARVAAIQHKIQLDDAQARTIHGTYQLTYMKVPVYWKRQVAWAKRNTYVENLIGRRVHFAELHERSRDNEWGYGSTAINYPIQSMGAEQKYLAMMMLGKMLPRFGGEFYFELHDGLFVILPEAVADEAVPEIKERLSNLPYAQAWKIELPIQFPVDAKVGTSWGDLQEVK